jgi:hypothetical protein
MINAEANEDLGYYTSFENWQANALRYGLRDYTAMMIFPDRPSNSELATTLKMRTNPSRPVVSLPQFVAELKDLPGLLRGLGRDYFTKAAKTNMNYQFGIAPLVGDLFKMTTLADHASKRSNELHRLFSQGGLRRKIPLYKETLTRDWGTVTFHDWRYGIPAHYRGVYTLEVSGWAKWLPDGSTLPPTTEEEYLQLAHNVCQGLNSRGDLFALTNLLPDLWELYPWSWLVDWFTNIGDFLSTMRNTVGADCVDIQLMDTHVYRLTFKPDLSSYTHGNVRCDRGAVDVVRKHRTRATPGLSAQLPFLSARQLSILGSLAFLRVIK